MTQRSPVKSADVTGEQVVLDEAPVLGPENGRPML